ncbi:hypothetical protein AAVH_09437 [Aphelenchoides avenae]|nr:hypothetical protein AAVH_09437 [Aphelenchus avenae]
MSSVPREVLRDVLQPLDRWTLDDVQFSNRRFLQLVLERMSDVCFREIDSAGFIATDVKKVGMSFYSIHTGGRSKRKISNDHKDSARLFSQFVQALRSSRVARLALYELVFTPELAALILESPITVRELCFDVDSCAELTPTQLNKVLQHFSPTVLSPLEGQFRASQISDELVRARFNNGMLEASFPHVAPVDGGCFFVSDDAIVELYMLQDIQVGQEEDEPYVQLELHNGSFTNYLFKRLVEASSVSTRTQSLKIVLSPSPVEDETFTTL